MDILLWSIYTILSIGILINFIVVIYKRHTIRTQGVSCIGIIIIICIYGLFMTAYLIGHKTGQIDALKGKQKYKQKI